MISKMDGFIEKSHVKGLYCTCHSLVDSDQESYPAKDFTTNKTKF